MLLAEALKIVKSGSGGEPYRAFLACGFEPLHLGTFLAAHLRAALPNRKVDLLHGRYGDLLGNVERAGEEEVDGVAAVVEWADLDPRLGVRQLGGWTPATEDDIAAEARMRLDALGDALERAAERRPIACALPTLPLAPFAHTPPWQASPAELSLRAALQAFASRIAGRIRLLNAQALDGESPPGARHDVRSELAFGFPYQLAHADRLAALLAKLIAPPAPKKALITDLDDCLWSGIVGEVGPGGVHWDLDHHAQIHGLYQQLLHSLAASGVLVGVASRNDPKQVEPALRRDDLLVPRDRLFPVEAGWGPKSQSIERIVRRWNLGFDAVVFVDDSPMELAEVKAALPEVECVQFPAADENAAYALFARLRALFGKERIFDEDLIRAESLRRARSSPAATAGDAPAANARFLEEAGAELTFTRLRPPPDPRALELVNKTNQFNLNGRRYEEAAWNRRFSDGDGVHLLMTYRDKFGPLGKIAVLSGRLEDRALHLDTWVMSCRAFGRQIEHGALKHLFERFPIREIAFDFVPTSRNGPVGDLLRFYLGERPGGRVGLTREQFDSRCPRLFHQARATSDE